MDDIDENIDRFVAESNVSSFFTQVASETEIAKRVALSRLLLAEEDRFAKLSEQSKYLDAINTFIEKCDAQITKHQALVDCRTNPENIQFMVQDVLKNMIAIKTILCSARQIASSRMDDLRRL